MARKSQKLRRHRRGKKTKRRGHKIRRKTMRRKNKRKTRRRKGGKTQKIQKITSLKTLFRLNMDIDGDLGFAKEHLKPGAKHAGDLSLQFFSTPTRLQKRLISYPTSPPVIKGFGGFRTDKKKTAEAQKLYQSGLQSQKASLEFILNDAFEEEKYIKKSGEELPPEYMIGNPVTTDAILKALDEPLKRLGQQNNLRAKVNNWRNSN
tara:strand:- start:48 stop:665 length:618 start_codon:yes stop_codon:yes gene_type:complete